MSSTGVMKPSTFFIIDIADDISIHYNIFVSLERKIGADMRFIPSHKCAVIRIRIIFLKTGTDLDVSPLLI